MASLRAACRGSSRLLSRGTGVGRSSFTTSARCLAAQNFTMPALSPTMTEGNIATWKVKEGESFSAGDVLLEIETDKATMDVEAQDDGIMMKIMAADGSKAVQVGTRIAVVAEAGDDVNSLEIPADEQPKQQKEAPKESSAAASSSSSSSQPQSESTSGSSSGGARKVASGESNKVNYPLLPSTQHLVKEKGISEEELSKITPTGPNGKLLKGDVLAYLGSINAETPGSISSRFDSLSHLDLSNIKVAAPKEKPAAKDSPAAAAEAHEHFMEDIEIQVPVSLAKVIEVQKKIKDTLDVFLPLSTFISRAAEVANDDLPLAAHKPTANELFDQVLGLDKIKAARGSRGVYLPQISAIPPPSMLAPRRPPPKADIIDILAAPKAKAPSEEDFLIPTVPGLSSGDNVFSLVVPAEEEDRAQEFLERCKIILEKEPGRLVL